MFRRGDYGCGVSPGWIRGPESLRSREGTSTVRYQVSERDVSPPGGRGSSRPMDDVLQSPYQLVGIATFRDQAIGRFPRQSVRSLLASLATTLDVPVVCP
jgi:hypothetical protein